MKFSKKLEKMAKKSDHRHKHATLIIKGGVIIGSGYNHNGIHAEIHALKQIPQLRNALNGNAKKFKPLVDAYFINIRLGKSGYKNSSPCIDCCQAMYKCGIRGGSFSIDNGFEHMSLVWSILANPPKYGIILTDITVPRGY